MFKYPFNPATKILDYLRQVTTIFFTSYWNNEWTSSELETEENIHLVLMIVLTLMINFILKPVKRHRPATLWQWGKA